MNKLQALGIVGTVAAVLILGLGMFSISSAQAGVKKDLISIKDSLADTHLGALSGPEIPSPYLQWGGVTDWRASMQAITTGLFGSSGTTTPCAIQAPAATSTLDYFSFNVQVGTSTAIDLSLAKSLTAFATSTPLLTNWLLPAGSNAPLVYTAASSTASTTLPEGRMVFAPNTWLVLGAKGPSGAASSTGSQFPNATCKAKFTQIGQ